MSLHEAIYGTPASSGRTCMAKVGAHSGAVHTVYTRRGPYDVCDAHERLFREAGEIVDRPSLVRLSMEPPMPCLLCDSPVKSYALCAMHYSRAKRRYGGCGPHLGKLTAEQLEALRDATPVGPTNAALNAAADAYGVPGDSIVEEQRATIAGLTKERDAARAELQRQIPRADKATFRADAADRELAEIREALGLSADVDGSEVIREIERCGPPRPWVITEFVRKVMPDGTKKDEVHATSYDWDSETIAELGRCKDLRTALALHLGVAPTDDEAIAGAVEGLLAFRDDVMVAIGVPGMVASNGFLLEVLRSALERAKQGSAVGRTVLLVEHAVRVRYRAHHIDHGPALLVAPTGDAAAARYHRAQLDAALAAAEMYADDLERPLAEQDEDDAPYHRMEAALREVEDLLTERAEARQDGAA